MHIYCPKPSRVPRLASHDGSHTCYCCVCFYIRPKAIYQYGAAHTSTQSTQSTQSKVSAGKKRHGCTQKVPTEGHGFQIESQDRQHIIRSVKKVNVVRGGQVCKGSEAYSTRAS